MPSLAAERSAASLWARWIDWDGDGLSRWQRRGLTLGVGAVSILAMAPVFATPVLFLTLPLWLVLIAEARARGAALVLPEPALGRWGWLRAMLARLGPAFGCGWWFGFGYHLVGLYWIAPAFLVEGDRFAWLLPFAVTLLPAAMAIYHGLAAAVVAWTGLSGVRAVIALSLALSLTEWLRGHLFTGFPWNVLGYALTWPLVLMQSASVVGIYGLTMLTVVLFALPLVWLREARRVKVIALAAPGQVRIVLLSLAAFAPLLLYGAWRLSFMPPADVAGVKIRIVQPSIPQSEKWRPERQGDFFLEHLRISGQGADGVHDDLKGITHVVWPEASMPFQPLRTPQALDALGRLLPPGTHLLAGALRLEMPPEGSNALPKAYNSLMVFGQGGKLEGLVDKAHLTPFGEYLPLQASLESLGLEQLSRFHGGFSLGRTPRPVLDVPGLPTLGVLICYEANFPGEVVQGSERPSALINVTNDGWFGQTSGPFQHFHQSQVRAVEEGLAMIRAANNGVSGLIDPYGRVLASLGLDVQGSLDVPLPGPLPRTLYGRFGDGLFFLLWLAAAAGLGRRRLELFLKSVS